MAQTTVNREERDSHVLSVRLTDKQFKRVQRTLRNFGIEGSSMSEQLRLLLRKTYWSSVRFQTRHKEIQRVLQLRRERERIQGEGEEEAPEESLKEIPT